MLLSIVVNLLSSVNGTQSASQAASPLLHHGGATQPHDCSMTPSINRKYITYRNAAGGRPGHKQTEFGDDQTPTLCLKNDTDVARYNFNAH